MNQIKNLFISTIFILICSAAVYCQTSESKIAMDSQFYTDSIYSENLGEYRKHNIYLPNDFKNQKEYKVIYATDGNEPLGKNFIKAVLDSLIANKIIEPMVYIGSYSNIKNIGGSDMQTDEGIQFSIQYRNFEYVEEFDTGGHFPNLSNRFKKHLLYFKDELIPQIEKELSLKINQNDRIFYGVSNGAGFGANLLNKFPDIIGTYICYSTLGSNVKGNTWFENVKYPDLYLQYGNQEDTSFKTEAENLNDKYEKSNSFCNLKTFNGGHDYKNWNEEFAKIIAQLNGTE